VFRNSWVRLLSPAFRAPFASLLDPVVGVPGWREGRSKDPKTLGIEAPDDTTLVLRLSEPAPHLVAVLAHYAFVPIHPRWNPSSEAPPPANGPFRLVKSEPGHWVLDRNPRYWDAAQVGFAGLDFRFNDDAPGVTKAYKEGLLDWVADGIDGTASLGQRYLSANSVFGTSFFYFKTDRAPWNDARVRQALILLLPLEELRGSYLQPTSVLVPSFQGYPEVKGIEKADQEKALALLAEAGYPNGQGLPPVVVALPDNDGYLDFIETFREAWKPLDLEVVYKPVKGSYYDQLATLDHTVGHFSWIGDFLDPVTFLVLWKGGSSLNSFSYADADYDGLLNRAATQGADERLKTLASAETKLLQDGLLIPLSHTPSFHLIDREEIGGWYPNALDIHPFKNLVRQTINEEKRLGNSLNSTFGR